ncbi:hypothetical protein RUM44_001397 [Polyplax serrata]|uniref:Cilia- and flagella-associated protein 206 n=1 Tax=Polyplax serrata TaxID=468196 RepID=A0ABR1AJZ3_POLSC
MDFNVERENNIVKNIAKEIVLECSQNGFEATQEMADYLVKVKLLNPKNGFTASEVMPRNLTQQLVSQVVEDLKQHTPAMNCIRMQVFWSTINLNIEKLKMDFNATLAEKAETYLGEILVLEREDSNVLFKSLASYTIIVQNLGPLNNITNMRETIATIHSILRMRHVNALVNATEEQKIQKIKDISKKVTGIRLFLKSIGKSGEAIEDVRNLGGMIEAEKDKISKIGWRIAARIEEIQNVIPNVVAVDYLFKDTSEPADVNLPPEFELTDLRHLKQIHTIMLQHNVYVGDITSKLEEIDGDYSFYMKKLNEILERLQIIIQERDTVPTADVYDDFSRAGEIWTEIYSYYYCLESVQSVANKLEEINKKEYFNLTPLERVFHIPGKGIGEKSLKEESSKSLVPSSVFLMSDSEDFHLEFRGFCAWTLYFAEGYLIPGNQSSGYYQYNDQYYSFATKVGQEMWSKDPYYYLIRIYEFLRLNPELIGLLNAYETLYNTKSLQLMKKVGRKVSSVAQSVQTLIHPIEKYWDKDYTFSEWELKKRALVLSRMAKCVTKSVQTSNHSHFRSSIGIYAAPDKDKEVQTKRDSSCVHPTIGTYLYGLRGHRENKFKVLTLTRPVEEICERIITLETVDPCRERQKKLNPEKFARKKKGFERIESSSGRTSDDVYFSSEFDEDDKIDGSQSEI